jgi:ribosome-binding protein aMBF1 (putative translation factor)
MNATQRKALEAAGVIFEHAEDFLELSEEERKLVRLRLAVCRAMRDRRKKIGLTQSQLAKRLNTSQPRIARMEAAADDVSLDQMFSGLFALGGSIKDIVKVR